MIRRPSNWFAQLRERLARQQHLQEPVVPAPDPEPRRLGLALGGGGGKGAAHIGVLQVLAEFEVPIDLIVGTSAGGAVAILYAAGFSAEQICETFRSTALRRIAITDPTRTGLIGQRKRQEILLRLLEERTFADLHIPCAVVSTDLVTGTPVVIREGLLVDALLATTCLPSIFPPVIRDQQILVDGGLVNNLPVDVAFDLGAQKVIAVNLTDGMADFSLAPVVAPNPLARLMLAPQQFAIASRALSLMMSRVTELQLRQCPPDLLIRPDVMDIPLLDMSNPEKGLQAGINAAREVTAELIDLQAWRLTEPMPPEPQPPPIPARPRFSFTLPRLNLPGLPGWPDS